MRLSEYIQHLQGLEKKYGGNLKVLSFNSLEGYWTDSMPTRHLSDFSETRYYPFIGVGFSPGKDPEVIKVGSNNDHEYFIGV